jgi:hypothetical protein
MASQTPVKQNPNVEKNQLLYIAKSTIVGAGRGVFAKKDILANTSVCYYDGYKRPSDDVKVTDLESSYMLGNGVDAIIGYISPRTEDGIAQIINDVSRPIFSNIDDKTSLSVQTTIMGQICLDYVNTMPLCNVMCVSSSIFKTNRAIAAGEELFFHYGIRYWLSAIKTPISLVLVASIVCSAYKNARDSVEKSIQLNRTLFLEHNDGKVETLYRHFYFCESMTMAIAFADAPSLADFLLEHHPNSISIEQFQEVQKKGCMRQFTEEKSESFIKGLAKKLSFAYPLFQKHWLVMNKRFVQKNSNHNEVKEE